MNSNMQKPIRLTFFGDSICVGQGISIYRGWVTRIAQSLEEYGQTHKNEILVVNSSINGRTTRQALEDMPYHVQNQGLDILVVQFGLNDCNYWKSDRGVPRVSLPAYVANMREIIERGKRFGAKRILLNNNHPTTRNDEVMPFTNFTYEESNKHYNGAVRNLATELGDQVMFHDIEEHFQSLIGDGAAMSQFLLSDGLHLSQKGHEQYYKVMLPSIQRSVDYLISERDLKK